MTKPINTRADESAPLDQDAPPAPSAAAPEAFPLPHHSESESGTIAALLGHGRQIAEQIAPILGESDFYFARYRTLYSAAMKVYAEGLDITPSTVAEALSRSGSAFNGAGGMEELVRMASNAPAARGALSTAKLVRNYRVRRDIIAAAHKAARLASSLMTRHDTVLTQSVALIQEAATGGTSISKTESAATIGMRVFRGIEERKASGCQILGIPTGLRTWDLQTGGIVPKKLNLIVGATGMGKTAAMLTMMHGTLKSGSPALVFSLEMENDALWYRCLSMTSGIDSRRVQTGETNPDEWESLKDAHHFWLSRPVEMNDWAGMTLRDIEAAVRDFVVRVKGERPPVVYVDFAQIIANTDGRGENEASKIQRNVYGLREMAKNMNLGLVLMAQLNRNVDSREDKRPRLSDIADSSGIAKAADTITTLYRPAYYATAVNQGVSESDEVEIISKARWIAAEPDEAEWAVEKCRDGGRRVLKMTYHPSRTMFTCGSPMTKGF